MPSSLIACFLPRPRTTGSSNINQSGASPAVSSASSRDGLWVTRDQVVAKIKGAEISFKSKTDESMIYSALWIENGQREQAYKSGRHLWTIDFGPLKRDSWPWVGLSSDERLGMGWATSGLFYGGSGNLSDGRGGLILNWGPGIKSGDRIRMLVSVNEVEDRVQIFFWRNGEPLGLAFDVCTSFWFPSGFSPAVQFCENGGRAHGFIKEDIETVLELESELVLCRAPKSYGGMEGPWKTVPGFIHLEGAEMDYGNYDYKATIKITRAAGKTEEFNIYMFVVNHINFTVTKTEESWKCPKEGATTLLSSTSDWIKFEQLMTELCKNPDKVDLLPGQNGNGGDQLTITKGDSRVIFRRFDDHPGPYIGY